MMVVMKPLLRLFTPKRIKKCIIFVIFTLGLFPFLIMVVGNRTLSSFGVDIGYLLRPLWEEKPSIPPEKRYAYSPELSNTSLCAMNGWRVYNSTERERRLVDVFIYAGEADLLEVRIRELWDVVDLFIIAEANLTFMGKPKPLYFAQTEQQQRFEFAMSKIVYVPVGSLRALRMGDSPFTNEYKMRRDTALAMIKSGGFEKDDLFVISDIDEIPYAHTLRLLKTCTGYPSTVHLKLDSYRYSFEFPLPLQPVTKSSVNVVKHRKDIAFARVYRRGIILADAGWHCSWCFRTIDEVRRKMASYSHADRNKRYVSPLTDDQIQRIMCSGSDIFGLLPEAYTFTDLIRQLGPVRRSKDVSKVPETVLRDQKKFMFLLPGNCVRPQR